VYLIEKQQKKFSQNKWAVKIVNPTSVDEELRPLGYIKITGTPCKIRSLELFSYRENFGCVIFLI
jgi:hypothetical protein